MYQLIAIININNFTYRSVMKYVQLDEEGIGAAYLMTFLFPSKSSHKTKQKLKKSLETY